MNRLRASRSEDDGFGLIEIVVSMFILALLALALLPLLVNGVQQSAKTATIATAVQQVQDRLDYARTLGSACTPIHNLAGTEAAAMVNGVSLQRGTAVAACPSTFPATVLVTVSVTRLDTGAILVTAATKIFVSS